MEGVRSDRCFKLLENSLENQRNGVVTPIYKAMLVCLVDMAQDATHPLDVANSV